jgi:hypothetical protein
MYFLLDETTFNNRIDSTPKKQLAANYFFIDAQQKNALSKWTRGGATRKTAR